MITMKALAIGYKNVGGESEDKALLYLHYANGYMNIGECQTAMQKVIQSLEYSVGVNHPDYIAVVNAYENDYGKL